MTTGFLEPRKLSPTGLALVIAMHAAALGALAFLKGPEILDRIKPTIIFDVPAPVPEPEPQPDPPRDQPQTRQQPTRIETVPPIVDTPIAGPTVPDPPLPPLPPIGEVGPETLPPTRLEPPPAPIRIAAVIDPRYSGDLQPPYPPSEERAQRGGRVRVRVTIGADGRVRAIERLSATSEAFWLATERHALARWRFRPATLDGRPVESSKTMNVYFRIEDA